MRGKIIGVVVGVLIGFLLVSGFALPLLQTLNGASTRVSAGSPRALATPSLSVDISNFFNVPYGEWWDYRFAQYGDIPVGADCFSFDSIPGGAGSPNPDGTGVCDIPPTGYSGETWLDAPPYINLYPWGGDRRDTFLNSPYLMHIVGVDQPGSTLADPVILPVFKTTEAAGTTLSVSWDLQYLTTARSDALDAACGSGTAGYMDGYILENNITITMDLQESKRIFGVVATTPAQAASWWASNSNPACATKGPVETAWEDFMVDQGGTSLVMKKYDIYNSYEWYYQPFITNFTASVDPSTGVTTVKISHVTYGTEVLLARWFYWGSSSYLTNAETYPHVRSGWWPWELAWFEDFHFDTTIGAADQDFTLDTVMQYHFQAWANPGPDGRLHSDTVTSTDDIAEWIWQPYLSDYMYGAASSPKHTVSELDPYAGRTFRHAGPGSIYMGDLFTYDLVPAEWNLGSGDTVTIHGPTTSVRFIDPYSPMTSDQSPPLDLVFINSMMGFYQSTPALPAGSSSTDSNGDGILDTINLVGPIDWGAPNQVPYPAAPFLEFTPQAPATAPTAPRNLAATAGNTQVTLDWQAPASDGGSLITNYKIYRGTVSGSLSLLTTVGNVLTYTDTGLTNGQIYYYQVSAVNTIGEGPKSSEVSATPSAAATAPSAPRNLQATASPGQIVLTWTAPATDGGSTITNYKVYRGTTSGSLTLLTTVSNVLTYTDSGLTAGTTYYYQVSAVNGVGEGPKSAEVFATVPNLPGAPLSLTAAPGNAQVILDWEAPASDGGSPITNYKVYRGTVSGSLSLLTTVGNVLTYTDTGLTNGQIYYYQVSAVNAVGEGPKTAEASATPVGAPTAPQNLQASAGNSLVTLTWQAPTSNGGSAITSYNIYSGTTSGSLTLLTTVLGGVLTYTNTGLTNGVTYYYQVSAVNAVGEGPKTAEVSATPNPPADTTNPAIAISSPTSGATLSSRTVTVSGTASDNVGLQKVEVSTDGTNWALATGTSSWSASMTLGEGSNTIYARATDTSGNVATVSISVTVSTAGVGGAALPWELIIPIIAVVILAAIVAVWLLRRKPKAPEGGQGPQPPPPPQPPQP